MKSGKTEPGSEKSGPSGKKPGSGAVFDKILPYGLEQIRTHLIINFAAKKRDLESGARQGDKRRRRRSSATVRRLLPL